jgi:hypothetical protein
VSLLRFRAPLHPAGFSFRYILNKTTSPSLLGITGFRTSAGGEIIFNNYFFVFIAFVTLCGMVFLSLPEKCSTSFTN